MTSTKFYIIRLVVLPVIVLLVQLLCLCKAIIFTVMNFFIPWTQPRVVRTPETRFEGLESLGYNFKPNYVEMHIGGGKTLPRVHYVDEGPRDAQDTILCLHGEPSWSFLYRHMIHTFVKAGYRVIAPDFIGFGKSDKYVHPESYTHDLHTQTLRMLLDHLKVKELTLVCQDWGGPVGLTVVKDSPNLFKRIVVMNTGLPAGIIERLSISEITRITPFLLWRSVAQLFGTFLPVNHLFGFAMKIFEVSKEVIKAYNAPFPSHLYKGGVSEWPLLVPVLSNTPVASEMQETRDFLCKQWQQKSLLMYADDDPITAGWFITMQKLLPKASVKTVTKAGHFLQEAKGEELATNIISFIDNKLQ